MIKNALATAGLLLGLFSVSAHSAPREIDHVTVVVNDGVILEGEIQAIVQEVKQQAVVNGQSLPSDKALRAQAIDRLILSSLQLQLAQRMGIIISDAHLDSVLQNIAQNQNLTIEQLRQAIVGEGQDYERYREKVRDEIAINEVTRANVQRRVSISPQEIATLVDLIDQQTSKEEFHIGHILIAIDNKATQSEVDARKDVADRVIELLNEGSDFKRIAIASSSGSKALEGGDWGFMSINEMPTLFAESMKGKKKGDLIGPLRSGAGFHIVKVMDVRGRETVEVKEVLSRHILLKPSIILSEQKAQNMLNQFVADVKAGKADFAELAKEHSEDPGSALKGGELGWSNPETYTAKFKETLATLEKGEYSAPFRSQFGWHVVQLMDERLADTTEQNKQDRAYQILFKRKFDEEVESWTREIREQAFIDIVAE